VSFANAQSVDETALLMKNREFPKALELIAKQMKKRPKDANLKLAAGICFYEMGDFQSSEKNLQLAALKNLTDANYYLGEIQYLSYRFAESASNFSLFVANPKSDSSLKSNAATHLKQAEMAARLIKGVEKVQIIDSLVVSKNEFLHYYRLSPEAGTIKGSDNFFNKKSVVLTSVYKNQRDDKMFFSDKTKKNGTDIFTRSRLLDTWGDTLSVGENINSSANENFPFVLSDGVTLYFSSDRTGSIGGFDIFVTRYNWGSDSYLTPENVGMPFNSIYNDYMLAIDEQNNLGWFASDRHQPEGKVVIYIFIPNETKTTIGTESATRIAQLASIHAIRETWKKEVDYTPFFQKLEKIKPDSIPKQVAVESFKLVINDRKIYHSWEDFKKDDARIAYMDWLKANDQIQISMKQLELLRTKFANSDSSIKQQLSALILPLEKQIEENLLKQKLLEYRIRKLEN
jgi:hypothetical protein